MQYRAHEYQKVATDWILNHISSGLFVQMGMGKTVATLTAIKELMYDRLEIGRVLVIAPLRVASTVWAQEAAKWDHLHSLTFSLVLGTEKERKAALEKDADIYVVNRENVVWLSKNHKWNFDMIVIDELTSFKNASAKRFRALKRQLKKSDRPIRVVGLTGTPAPNGLMDLWAQIYLLDSGVRLGRTLGSYRSEYFRPAWGNGYIVYKYEPLPGAEEKIKSKIVDICISMDKKDYLDMPDKVVIDIPVDLPGRSRSIYEELERDYLITHGESEISAASAGALNTKLMQIANGAAYDSCTHEVIHLHKSKLNALEDLIEQANGHSVLVMTSFKFDTDLIKKHLKSHDVRELRTPEDITDWNAGKISVAVGHPASIGHGLNLQQGGHILIWYGLTWSLELYQQANDRLYRQGQDHNVSIYHIVSRGTVDEACLAALKGKKEAQKALMDYLSARKKELEKGERK